MAAALCPDSPHDISEPLENQLEQCSVSKEPRQRFDSIFGDTKPKLKAYKPEDSFVNNPFI
jgi:hypothetical protein